MGKNVSKCVICGGQKFRRTTRERVYQLNETTFQVKVPCDRCVKCGEGYTHLDDIRRANRRVALDLVRNGGPVTGRSLKLLREAAQLAASELADLLGISPTTLSRWENDKQSIDRATWMAVGDLVLDPTATRRRLEALSISRAGETVRITLSAAD